MLSSYLMTRDRIYVDREETSALFRQGAKVFICGSKPMALGITAMCEKIYGEITGKSDEESKEWFKSVQADRFATDVFG
jgi:cytochrome P450/NADPH-cytochrome P450 reductase